jgi:hypothetical protein
MSVTLRQGLKLKSNAGQFGNKKNMGGSTSFSAVGNFKCIALN